MINLIVALRDDVVAEMQGELDEARETAKASILSHPDVQHVLDVYKRYHDGNNEWTAFSMYIEPSAELGSWFMMYAGRAKAMGAWDMDGMQYGTATDEEGNLVGAPVFPVDPLFVEFMPDVVTYDDEGAELTRTPATELTQVNLMAGQSLRLFV